MTNEDASELLERCLLCTGPDRPLAQLVDRDLGPLCLECFGFALNATVELRFQGLMCPSEE